MGLTWAWQETEQFISIETTTSSRHFRGTEKDVGAKPQRSGIAEDKLQLLG